MEDCKGQIEKEGKLTQEYFLELVIMVVKMVLIHHDLMKNTAQGIKEGHSYSSSLILISPETSPKCLHSLTFPVSTGMIARCFFTREIHAKSLEHKVCCYELLPSYSCIKHLLKHG